jgi:hypothetical protein
MISGWVWPLCLAFIFASCFIVESIFSRSMIDISSSYFTSGVSHEIPDKLSKVREFK